jgi:hypothetical protein
MFASPDPSLTLIPTEGGYYVDDRNYVYPSERNKPAVKPDVKVPTPDMFLVNSNVLAGNPEAIEIVRKSMITDPVRAKEAPHPNDSLRLKEEKKLDRFLDELKTKPRVLLVGGEATNKIPAIKPHQ